MITVGYCRVRTDCNRWMNEGLFNLCRSNLRWARLRWSKASHLNEQDDGMPGTVSRWVLVTYVLNQQTHH